MRLILIMVFNFESKKKSIKSHDVIIMKTIKTGNCQYISNTMTYETEIWHVEVIYDADFDNGIEIIN